MGFENRIEQIKEKVREQICPQCNGTGKIKVEKIVNGKKEVKIETCPKCNGRGVIRG